MDILNLKIKNEWDKNKMRGNDELPVSTTDCLAGLSVLREESTIKKKKGEEMLGGPPTRAPGFGLLML